MEKKKKNLSACEFFDYVAESIQDCLPELLESLSHDDFLNFGGITPKYSFPLSFTFSFALKQTSLNSAIVLQMSKGWNLSGIIGEDAGALLQNSLTKRNIPVHVVCLINDAVGTYMSAAYKHNNTIAGAVVGTGTNAAYYESKWKRVINTEWGALAKNSVPINKFDIEVDRKSADPGINLFEKMATGEYLGELTRLVLIEASPLFTGPLDIPVEPFSISTKTMCIFYAEETIVTDFMFGIQMTPQNKEIIQRICQAILRRSAALIATGIAALYKRVNLGSNDNVNVSIDGSIFIKTAGYSDMLSEYLNLILGDVSHKIFLTAEEDGSSIGGAVVAAMAEKEKKRCF